MTQQISPPTPYLAGNPFYQVPTYASSNTQPGQFGYLPPVTPPGRGIDPPSRGTDPPGTNINRLPTAMENFSLGAEGIAGLAGAYSAYKQTGLLEDQLNMQLGLANRNLENSAATTNLNLSNQATMAGQMLSGSELGTAAQQQSTADNLVQVDGTPIT